jgi:hypothetical protein
MTNELTTVRTRTGRDSHYVLDLQPTTLCGRYLRANPMQMRVDGEATCEKCLKSGAQLMSDAG